MRITISVEFHTGVSHWYHTGITLVSHWHQPPHCKEATAGERNHATDVASRIHALADTNHVCFVSCLSPTAKAARRAVFSCDSNLPHGQPGQGGVPHPRRDDIGTDDATDAVIGPSRSLSVGLCLRRLRGLHRTQKPLVTNKAVDGSQSPPSPRNFNVESLLTTWQSVDVINVASSPAEAFASYMLL